MAKTETSAEVVDIDAERERRIAALEETTQGIKDASIKTDILAKLAELKIKQEPPKPDPAPKPEIKIQDDLSLENLGALIAETLGITEA